MGLIQIPRHINQVLCFPLSNKGHVHMYAILAADMKPCSCCAARGAGLRGDVCSVQSQ